MIARFDRKLDHWVLWEDEETQVVVQVAANWPAKYGGHVVVEQKRGASTPHSNYRLFAKMNIIAAVVQKGLEETGLAPHANIGSFANWAFRSPDGSFRKVKEGQRHRNLHVHVYGRDPEDPSWGDPLQQANWQEQQEGKYWGQIWTEKQIQRITAFLGLEVPRALGTLG